MQRTAILRSAAVAALLAAAGPVAAADGCRDMPFEAETYAVCEVTAGADVRLFLYDGGGEPIGTFARLSDVVVAEGGRLVFAMNAGMYHPDRRPVGLYVEEHVESSKLVRSAGPGNFGLLPNGVFCIGAGGFIVQETRAFDAARPDCRFATQSGPLLVMEDALHPKFLAESESRYVRNGVGVSADGQTAWFVISDRAVTFHDFARLFRDGLHAPDALYFDGNISRLYAPAIGRDDLGFPMGPMVGLVAPAE
ncbi:MAG: phosphodiester glycosidase family protein [Rhodobacteraceae bacterium]|nr:phosphodiester glycosidase family protein [Paracoccaceae bacterium]